jgi:soluble lytic murein transglycosylase-like protein
MQRSRYFSCLVALLLALAAAPILAQVFTQSVQLAAPATSAGIPAAPLCLEQAAQFHQVNAWVLRAILWHESKNNAAAMAINTNKTIDAGIGQINSVHFAQLAQYGIAPQHLLEPCVGVYVAAWHLAKQHKTFGNTWAAVGAYHSRTPQHRDAYAAKIASILQRWGVV